MTNQTSADHLNAASTLSLPRRLLHRDGTIWEQVSSLQETSRDNSQSTQMRTILVPLDGSLHAEHALPHALAIARRSGAVVRLVHVHSRLDHIEPWDMYPSFETNERRKREKGEYLLDVADRIVRTNAVTVETTLIDSTDTEDSLARAAESVDLVVIASRRRGFFRRLWSYSVADALRRRLLVPVLCVRGYPSPVDLTGDPIARHVLMPLDLDGLTFTERILNPVNALVRLEGGRITLLNMQNREWKNGFFDHTNPPGYLLKIARDARRAVPHVDATIVTTDQPLTSAVTSFAEDRHVDLIALATRSDSSMARLFEGSLADKLIRRTDLPILLVGIDVAPKHPEVSTAVE